MVYMLFNVTLAGAFLIYLTSVIMHHIFKYGFKLHFLFDAQTSWVITPGDILSASCSNYFLSVWLFRKIFGWPANIWKVAFTFTPTPLLLIRWLFNVLLAHRDQQGFTIADVNTDRNSKSMEKLSGVCKPLIHHRLCELDLNCCQLFLLPPLIITMTHSQSVLHPSTYLLQLCRR